MLCKRSAAVALGMTCLSMAGAAQGEPPVNDYPTAARVEFVNECISASGGTLARLYQCACVIDRFADRLSYDEFVAAGTFARYGNLPGEAGGVFRDSDEARAKAKLYKEVEQAARKECGLPDS